MITTAVLPAPVLHGDSLPKPQMWASDHSGSIRAHLFQIHNEDKKSPALVWSICWKCGQPGKERRVQEARNDRSRKIHQTTLIRDLKTLGVSLFPQGALCPVPLSYTLSFYICSRSSQRHTRKHSLPGQSNHHQTSPRQQRPQKEKCKQARVVLAKRRNHENGDKEALRKPWITFLFTLSKCGGESSLSELAADSRAAFTMF